MCGIAGIVNIKSPISLNEIKKMTDAIAHRGPDGEGQWINNSQSIALGHRRLSIIDLSEDGKQPMHFADERYSITFNGEVYNYIELRNNLEKQGVAFKSKSDTEVLLALFALKKEKCLEDLDGMFSFAIWDEQEQKLFCARDRFGEKPFYYHHIVGSCFVFASEMKALWSYGVPKIANNKSIINFHLNKSVDSPLQPSDTFYVGIHKLPPAHYLYVNANLEIKQTRYWDINPLNISQSNNFEDSVDKFKELFLQSIRLRLRSDVPVGSSLSGGLDSSAIVCAIDKLNANKQIVQKTFSARFKNFVKDEGVHMQKVIDKTKVDPYFVWPDAQGFAKDFQALCYHQEEPFPGGSIYAQWRVMQLAKSENVTVLLDGQGADEILAGYHYYFYTYLNQLYKQKSALYDAELKAYKTMHNPSFEGFHSNNNSLIGYLKKNLKTVVMPIYNNLKRPNSIHSTYLNQDFIHQFTNKDLVASHFDGGLNEQLYSDTCINGLQNLLRFADRNSMAHSREVRLPFLSHHLVEFCFSLPDNYKINNGWTKYILRKSTEDILPHDIAWRTDKIGYEPPQQSWQEQPELKELIGESVNKLKKEKILNASYELGNNDVDWFSLAIANTIF